MESLGCHIRWSLQRCLSDPLKYFFLNKKSQHVMLCSCQETIEGYTAAMTMVYNRKKEREEYEKATARLNTNSSAKRVRTRSSSKISPEDYVRSPIRTRSMRSCKSRTKKAKAVTPRRTYSLRG